jgi:hypothetical protein
MPADRYVVEAVDEVPELTREEEEGLVEALQSIDRGEGESEQEVRLSSTITPKSPQTCAGQVGS